MYCSYGDIIMKSENSGAQEIEFLRSRASMDDAFLRQSVSKQRQSKIKDFLLWNFYALWHKISIQLILIYFV